MTKDTEEAATNGRAGDTESIFAGAVNSSSFRYTLSRFCSGIAVVTGLDGPEPVGFTCQSFAAISLSPPLVMFSPNRSSESWARMRPANMFAVNILSRHQEETSQAFAKSGGNKFLNCPWRHGIHKMPLLLGSIAHIECRIFAIHQAGDHDIVVGQVLTLSNPEVPCDPLLYFRSRYHHLG